VDREPPPVTVTAPQDGDALPDVLEGAPPSTRGPWPAVALVGLAVVVLGALAVRGSEPPAAPDPPPPAFELPTAPPPLTATSGITATVSLGGAATDQAYVQRLALTVGLPAYDGSGDSGGRLLGDEIVLLDVGVRGFAVETDDPRSPLPLGRFGRATEGRSTTVPLAVTAVVDDCSVETEAQLAVLLTVATGEGPGGVVRAEVEPAVVRALDRLVSRTCRRPRG